MLHSVIGNLLLMIGVVSMCSSIIHICIEPELWWSRLALAMILFGLWYAGNKEKK